MGFLRSIRILVRNGIYPMSFQPGLVTLAALVIVRKIL